MDAATPPSGIPYLAYLSGLNLGQGGQSGVTDPSLSGQPAQAKGGAGMAGGLGLDELSQLLAAQQASDIIGAGTGQSLLQGIGGLGGFGNLGQGAGGFGSFGAGGALTPGPPQGTQNTGIAGQTGGSLDAMSLIKQALGLAKTGAGLLGGQQGGYQTVGDTGVSLSDQLRSGQAGVASPTVDMLGQPLNALTQGVSLSDTLRDIPQGTATVGQPQITGYGSPDFTLTNTLGQSPQVPAALANLGVTADQLPAIMSAIGQLDPQAQQVFQAELGMGGPQATFSPPGAAPGGGASLGGAVAGGAQGLQGILSAIQALTGQGTDLSKALGTVQGLGGAASGGAALSDALGLTSGLGGAIGGFGAPAGVLLQLAQILGGGPLSQEGMEAQGQQIGLTGLTAPIAGAAAAAAANAAPAGSALAAVAPVLSGLAGPLAFAAPVLGAIMAIMQAVNKPGNEAINRLTGVQGPQTTQALQSAASLLPPGTDYSQLPTPLLEALVPREGAALERFYNQNLPEDRYLTGLQAEQSPEFGQVQQALQGTQTGLLSALGQLQQRGVDVSNLLAPQLNPIAQMYNSNWAGVPGYMSPAALMQQQGLASNEALAGVYGGPTWLALNQLFGPGLSDTLSQYGITAPAMNLPQAPTGGLVAANAASQYNPSLPATAEQIASQYNPNYAATPDQIALQYGAVPWLGSPE